MKVLWKEICFAVLMGAVFPGLILNYSALLIKGHAEALPILDDAAKTNVDGNNHMLVSIRFPDAEDSQMDMEEFLTGVVLAEMPAEFEPEALKAQAVAARTYIAKAMLTGGKHGDGSVCTDPDCCQAYISKESYLNQGGTEENYDKVRKAIMDTAGWVLTYGGELIEATYFSCSGGSTEDAAAVWGTDYPYLRAVSSLGEENARHYSDTEHWTPAQFEQKTGCKLTGEPAQWFNTIAYTPGGGIDTILICGEEYSGKQLRQLLDLKSTAMTISADSDTITIVTKGYGHRVGMSQYGADAMAVAGSHYKEILEHYYPGATLVQLS